MHDADHYDKQVMRAPSVPQISVDRYLFLESEEEHQMQELETYRRRMQGKRERMAKLQDELNRELDRVEILAARQDECEAEKERLWDAMSKEDFREMGRRDVHHKRQKVN
jgi:hypothetical protein